MQAPPVRRHTPTALEADALREARVAFMRVCPFLSYYYISELKEVFTLDVPTAATDGRHVLINPTYFAALTLPQRVFLLAHETDHAIFVHPTRFRHYEATRGPDGDRFDWKLANFSADYVINARLRSASIGEMHADWLFDPRFTGEMLWEDVYRDLAARRPKRPQQPQNGQGRPCPDGGADLPPPSTAGQHGARSAGATAASKAGNAQARAEYGAQDGVLAPPTTGEGSDGQGPGTPGAMAHKEAVARAAAYAKGQGTIPGCYVEYVNDLLDPKIDWKDQLRLTVVQRIGSDRETWSVLNRRRICLNPQVGLPGYRGHGADTVVVAIDASGSIFHSPKMLATLLAELGGVVTDCNPRRLIALQFDARVQHSDEVRDLADVEAIAAAGLKGGGGTSFVPLVDWIADEGIVPEVLIVLTDGDGTIPEAPPFSVIWALCDGDRDMRFGDKVIIPDLADG